MTNFDKWQLLCKDFTSPQIYVDFTYYYMIAAALQRRVWLGPDYAKLYPNMYMILCGGPAIGKGLMLKTAYSFLSFYKKDGGINNGGETENDIPILGQTPKRRLAEDPLLIPIGSDSTTWQGLVMEMIDAYDAIPVPPYIENGIRRTTYHHSSLAYCLEELATIFQKKTNDVANFFLKAYDCEDYRYRTVERKVDIIKKPCMNFLAGTTPSFMQDTFDDKILNEGFSSRTFYLCAEKNRKDEMFFKPWDMEQQIARMDLLLHLKNLTSLYGELSYTKEAYEFLEDWWPRFRSGKIPRANPSPKLESYYGRLKVHVQKMAIAIHFGEVADKRFMQIGLPSIKRAIEMLSMAEKKMHLALTFKASNPLATAGRKLMAFLEITPEASMEEIQVELYDYIDNNQTEEMVNFYISAKKIKRRLDEKRQKYLYSKEKI